MKNKLEELIDENDKLKARIVELESGMKDLMGQLEYCKNRNDELFKAVLFAMVGF